MSDGFEADEHGVDELIANCQKLGSRLDGEILEKGLRAASTVLRNAIVERAPEKTEVDTPKGTSLPKGALKQDIVIRGKLYGEGIGAAVIGPSTLTDYVAYWLEISGHRVTTRGGSRKGRKVTRETSVPPKPFMAPAVDETGNDAIGAFSDVVLDELEKGGE